MEPILISVLVLLVVFAGLLLYMVRKNSALNLELQKTIRNVSELESKANQEVSALKREIEILSKQKAEKQIETEKESAILNEKIETLNKEVLRFSNEKVQLASEKDALLEKLENQKKEIEEIRQKFQAEFKNLANEIFEEKSKKFNEQNRHNIDEILKPLGEKIKDFEKKVEETYDKESKLRFSLKEEVKMLHESTQKISKEATDLTRALKGENKTMGNWGEVILEGILEKSGLQKGREYFVQASFTGPDGKRYQPDVVISYPGNKHVVIDSKVSLVAYERYINSENSADRERNLKEHLASIRRHIQELSTKSYQDIADLGSLDFTMMFMPVEPAFVLALSKDPELWNYAYDKRIILIGPTNLIAALKLVENLWQQEYQSRNVAEIARQSGALYDKFVLLLKDLSDIGKKIDDASTAHKNALNKLQTGRGNLIGQVEKIRKLGARAKKEIPQSFLNSDNDE